MKVLFFDDRPHGVYGAKHTMLAVAAEARRRGHDVLVASTSSGPFLDLAAERGFDVGVVPARGAMLEFERSFFRSGPLARAGAGFDLIRLQLRLARFVRTRRIDVVFVNSLRSSLETAGLVPFSARVVWYVQIAEQFGPISRVAGSLPDRLLGLADEVSVTAGGAPGTDFFDRLIPLGVGLEPFLAVPPAASPGPLRVVSVGAFFRRKGHHVALDVLERVGRDAQLTIAGTATDPDGEEYRAEIEACIERSRTSVELVGHIDDVAQLLAANDVLLHMASVEGTPRVIIEAMAASRPVVCTDAGGTAALVEHGVTGFVVPVDDDGAAAAALDTIAADPELARTMGQAGRRRALSRFSEQSMVRALVDEIEQARRSRRHAALRVAKSWRRARRRP